MFTGRHFRRPVCYLKRAPVYVGPRTLNSSSEPNAKCLLLRTLRRRRRHSFADRSRDLFAFPGVYVCNVNTLHTRYRQMTTAARAGLAADTPSSDIGAGRRSRDARQTAGTRPAVRLLLVGSLMVPFPLRTA